MHVLIVLFSNIGFLVRSVAANIPGRKYPAPETNKGAYQRLGRVAIHAPGRIYGWDNVKLILGRGCMVTTTTTRTSVLLRCFACH